MSLDVYVETACEHCGASQRHGDFNYTYNVIQLWSDALRHGCDITNAEADKSFGAYLEEGIDAGMRAFDFVPTLKHMVEWMNKQDLKKYDASNGWGTGDGGRNFVVDILECCVKNPKATVRVSR